MKTLKERYEDSARVAQAWITKRTGFKLEKKLIKDDWLRQTYGDLMNKYQEKGYISKVDPTTSVEQEGFLPLSPVVRNDRETTKGDRVKGILNSDEILQAENYHIKRAQGESFEEDIKRLYRGKAVRSNSVLSTMLPKIDEDGLLRMTGRLSLIEVLPYHVRYPISLPRKHDVTRLVVKQYHEKGNHAVGTNHSLSLISEKFWIIHGREEVREYERNCVVGKRNSVKPATQVMAPLPKQRVRTSLRAFSKVAVDYGEPFFTVQGKRKMRAKRYLC
ncbi:hypothetical protein HOLleu_35134 [Holothuria leucospilota]|uniref:Integrase zinc-binding domain-containing protein n=1 Tax=Holothuria leucospilota TaxID=206669 RepID=A0A9Q0YM89_HOLLE|nr:hypothetical protein HOLleu_35134 [Holothuria leucospilota]